MSDLYSAHPRRRTVSLASGMLLLAAVAVLPAFTLPSCDPAVHSRERDAMRGSCYERVFCKGT